MSLYADLKASNIPIDHHESDLYFLSNSVSTEILNKYPIEKGNSKLFRNEIDRKTWVEVPFAFLPFWEKKIK